MGSEWTGMAGTATDAFAASGIVGNRELLSRLDRDIRAGQLSHAYILDGPPGSGRHTIARHICMAIACECRPGNLRAAPDPDQMGFFDELFPEPEPHAPLGDGGPLPCRACEACRRVEAGTSPDIYIIGREGKASIGVDAVRHLRREVLIGPSQLDTKIYIIEDAETMTVQAQNALLLTLEEPPPYVLFLLLTNGADALLETIRSRAPILRTEPIPDEAIRAHLGRGRITLSEAELAAVILRADGCIGQALLLSDAKGARPVLRLREMCDAFMEAVAARRWDMLPAILNRFGNKRDGVQSTLALITLATRDLTLLRRTDKARLKYYTDREAAEALCDRMTDKALLRLYTALGRAAAALEANGNIRLTLLSMAVEISS